MYIVIMAGGKGTRFWPRSRASRPKQLLDIISERSMIQETVDRVQSLTSKDKILIVTNEEQASDLKLQLPGIPDENILREPIGRNTAPCICLAAAMIHQQEPDHVMAVIPADHYIEDNDAYLQCLKKAGEAADAQNALITIGITPRKPETGYGYIQFDDQCIPGLKGVYPVTHFHEKPDREKAVEFLKSGNYLWNSGMFVWKASVILDEIKSNLPDTYNHICDYVFNGKGSMSDAYEQIESISIDYGVMEKAKNVLTMKGDFGWNDIGSWAALHDAAEKDENSNFLRGDATAVDSENVLVYSPKKFTAVVGLKDIIVVETDDALLVCSKDMSQDVRRVVEQLEKKGRKELL